MDILDNIKFEAHRRLRTESLARINQCVSNLTDDELWYSPHSNLVSIGHLILHLEGNVRQWIISGIGGAKDERNRDFEFTTRQRINRKIILSSLERTINEALDCINEIDSAQLSMMKEVQGFSESILSIIIHVIEHFSYHTGQITYYTKWIKNIDTGYYKDLDLNIKS